MPETCTHIIIESMRHYREQQKDAPSADVVQHEPLCADPLRERACHRWGAMSPIARLRLDNGFGPVAACAFVLVDVWRQVRVCCLVHQERDRYTHFPNFRRVEAKLGSQVWKSICEGRVGVDERYDGGRVVCVPEDNELAREGRVREQRELRELAKNVADTWVYHARVSTATTHKRRLVPRCSIGPASTSTPCL